MNFKTVGIIGGKGLMGRLMADFFKSRGMRVLISDLKTKLSNIELVKKSDVIVISVPIDVTKKVIREILPFTRKNQLLTDVTSIKVFPIKEMLKSKASVIGLHPMFRPSSSGFKGQTIVICPARCTSGEKKWLKKLFEKSGARVSEMSAKKHDSLMAVVQVLIHFNSLVFGHTLRELKVDLGETMKAMSPVYRMRFDIVCRIFAQNPSLYANIQMLNSETPKVLRTFLKTTAKMTRIAEQKNFPEFLREFKKTTGYLGNFSKKALLESDKFLQFFKR